MKKIVYKFSDNGVNLISVKKNFTEAPTYEMNQAIKRTTERKGFKIKTYARSRVAGTVKMFFLRLHVAFKLPKEDILRHQG